MVIRFSTDQSLTFKVTTMSVPALPIVVPMLPSVMRAYPMSLLTSVILLLPSNRLAPLVRPSASKVGKSVSLSSMDPREILHLVAGKQCPFLTLP